ncbi:CubicO group peptidase (beta-lactamase class C family) [Archangium gephyra]|uniref:Beta-lactamase n=2 Tax=Archangium gephyra TaxID=48 RepID=A0AAC8QJM1_9BACT|nr:serine hydrolase domain-containing protein [Archangium gephyra]AKJ08481.1 Beta-lactamase [Archangium gephyra]REG20520.1 CubicO group peptidase (beta-lactamase class C family) [Archangium gephyra]
MRALLAALLLLCLTAPLPAPARSRAAAASQRKDTPFPAEVQRALDALVRAELAKGPHAGLSVGVLHGGMRWVQGYGLRDLAHKLPATPRTTYRMASITKSFTAVAVMQLVQEGKLELDTDVRSWVPQYPEKPWKFTVRQLLGHLGGVPHYDGPEAAENTQPLDTAGALALFADKPLAAEPGTKFVYTTWGYNLLGAAVEKASGQGYGRYLKSHVFGPAGMRHAALDDQRTRDKQHAVGYRPYRGQLVPSHFLDVSSRFAGGGTRASVEDLLAFGQAILQHKLVPAETARMMQASMSTREGQLTDYGLGFATYPLRGHYMVAHAGGQPETTSLLVMLPAEDVVIAIASNLEGEAKRQRRISTRIIETLLEDGLVRRDAHLVDPVDAVVHEGLARLFTYGLSYHLWATRGPGVLPEPGDLSEAFTRMSGLLDRATIAQDPQAALQRVRDAHQPREGSLLIRVGAHMALTLEKTLGPEKLREYPQRGALAFFTDYLAACEQVPCATPLRFSESLQKDARHFDDVWQRAQVSELRRVRLDEVKDAEALWPALELATANTSLHPDYVDEMVRVAGLLGKRGRKEEQLRWLERAVALHPQSAPAREALAKVQAPGTQETPEVPAATAPRRATDGSSPVPDDAGLLPASHPVPQRPQERAAEQGG